jgi:hypothetical protein
MPSEKQKHFKNDLFHLNCYVKTYHMKLHFIPLLVLFFFFSCASKKEDQTTGLKAYEVDLDAELTSLFDVVTDVEFTVLEETENSLFGSVGKLALDGDDLIIITGKGTKAMRFNREGKYLSSISERGRGPKEYSSISDLMVVDDKVLLLDASRQRITQWTKDWEYDSAFRLGFGSRHFIKDSQGYFYDLNYELVADMIHANVITIGKDFSLELALIPFKEPKSLLISNTLGFSKVDENIHYRPGFSDTVYAILPQRIVKPAYRFEFGKYWRFANEFQTDMEFWAFMSDSKGKPEALIYFSNTESENWIFGIMQLVPTNRTLGVLLDKNSEKKIYLNIAGGDDFRDSVRPILVENERVYASIDANHLNYILANYPQFEKTIKGNQSLEKVLASENPMIMSFKFKL